MKFKNTILLAILLSCYLSVYSQEEQIPNSNFENWTDIYHATGWNSQITFVTTFNTAERTSDNYQGNYAAKLTTKSYYTLTLPGMITLGDVDYTNLSASGGIPFTSRPTGISFYMKYATVQDTMMMLTYLTKWNSETLHTDTIGGIIYMNNETYSEYTKISLPVIYYSEEIPDTLNMIFLSSLFSGNSGTSLFLDSISMDYGLQILPTICLPATNISESGFTANWLPIQNATSYSIDLSTDETFTNFVENFNNFDVGNTTHFDFSFPVAEPQYFYRVRVNYDTEQSINSNRINANLPIPTICNEATDITYQSFTANWNTLENATNYYIDVATDSEFTNFVSIYENFPTGITDSVNITGLYEITEYFYRVRVEYEDYITSNSNVISLITDEYVNIQPVFFPDFTIVTFDKNIEINISKYEVYKVDIYDLSGKMIGQVKSTNSKTIIPVQNSGTYIVKISVENKQFTQKVIVN